MNKFSKSIAFLALAAAVCTPAVSAKTAATDSLVNNFMRSSIYTILLNSKTQNDRYEKEAKEAMNADAIMSAVKSLANTDAKKAANDTESGTLFSLPAKLFPSIEIPNQFNDHNLEARVLDFDALRANVTDEEKDKYNPKTKNQKAGAMAKGLAGGLMGSAAGKSESSMLRVDEVDEYLPAVLHKYFAANNTAANLLAKWYNYDASNAESHWNMDLVTERGNYNFSREDLARAATDQAMMNKVNQTAFDMINNTYVLAFNLRFRSYQAVVAEAAAIAKAAGSMFGGIGQLAATAGSAIASAAAGDGYTVQAVSHLYKLKWNDDLNQNFAVNIYEKNASVDDLISSGLCELEFVGKEKASANVRQSLFSDKPFSDLVKRATTRAIDAAIAKLQAKNEVFRTVMPIIGGDGNGTIYAAIGTKEGLNEKDEYEILEAQEDADGKTTYKSVGSVKPIKGKIWNNVYGAEEEAAENKAKAEAKDKNFDDEAVSLGYSEFKGKKGDYTGYFLRLKKKK